MKMAVIGSRSLNISIYDFLEAIKLAGILVSDISGFISGGAAGVDSIAPLLSDFFKLPCEIIKPDYILNKKSAPIIRNKIIVEKSDFILAFWDGESKGTLAALDFAKKLGVPFFIVKKGEKKQDTLF